MSNKTETTTREEHLEWCKQRALEYCDAGKPQEAYASMASDLGKHPETQGHIAVSLGLQLMMIGDLNTPDKMATFIRGFN